MLNVMMQHWFLAIYLPGCIAGFIYVFILSSLEKDKGLLEEDLIPVLALDLLSWGLVFICIVATIDHAIRSRNMKHQDYVIRGNNPNIQDDVDTTPRLPKTTISIE